MFRSMLHVSGQPITSVYFPETGYASLIVTLEDGGSAEVGMIGHEGLVGVPLISGIDYSPVDAMVQEAGTALRLDARIFKRVMDGNLDFSKRMLRFATAFNFQVTMTAACNIKHVVKQRLSRWLLMAHDRTIGDTLAVTHDFLSIMLGVHRPGISVAMIALQKEGLIQNEQGRVTILNRQELEKRSCECHRRVVQEFRRLLP